VSAEMSCKFEIEHFYLSDVREAEQANNNLHIWELADVFKALGSIQNSFVTPKYKVLAPKEVASLFRDEKNAELSAGATSEIGNAQIITALNGPMSHIYVQGVPVRQVAEIFKLMFQKEDAIEASQWFGLEEIDYKQIRETDVGRMRSSIDKILIRVSGNYCVFTGLYDDGSVRCEIDDSFSTPEYVDSWFRIKRINHPVIPSIDTQQEWHANHGMVH